MSNDGDHDHCYCDRGRRKSHQHGGTEISWEPVNPSGCSEHEPQEARQNEGCGEDTEEEQASRYLHTRILRNSILLRADKIGVGFVSIRGAM